MDYKQGQKFSDLAQEICLKLLKKESLNKEEKVQMISAAEAQVFLLSKVAGGMHLARAHWLAARCFYRINEASITFLHAQFCEFLTKSSSERSLLDEAVSLDILGRSLILKGQENDGQRCLEDSLKVVEKMQDASDVKYFREYLHEVSTGLSEKGVMKP